MQNTRAHERIYTGTYGTYIETYKGAFVCMYSSGINVQGRAWYRNIISPFTVVTVRRWPKIIGVVYSPTPAGQNNVYFV